jgi:hypothetical protein
MMRTSHDAQPASVVMSPARRIFFPQSLWNALRCAQ